MMFETGANPWKTINSRVVHQGEFLSVREDSVITPGGTQGKYDILILGNGCSIVPVSPEGKLYFVGLWRYPTQRYSIELPGGGSEDGEAIIETGKRELLEETGLVASKWTRIGSVDTLNWRSDSVNEVLLAEGVEKVRRHDRAEMMQEGIDKTIKLSLNEVLNLIHEGKVTHSITIAALFLYVSHAGRLKHI